MKESNAAPLQDAMDALPNRPEQSARPSTGQRQSSRRRRTLLTRSGKPRGTEFRLFRVY
jgi:hypothetical protein